ncbi:MAG: SCO family protein [Gammaproteobacteria bacterium]|nr:SCO family protein [Gammaproteobacteria bacterium]
MQEEHRQIPVEMQDYLESPPRLLPPFSLRSFGVQALTNEWFADKWSFVYFSHGHCLPSCKSSLSKIKNLQASFANNDLQFLIVGIDSEHETAENLADFLKFQQLDFANSVTASSQKIDSLASTFRALFLQTDYADGSYKIEQEHHIFVVDPKGRVYATFRPSYTDSSIESAFIKLRHFYARTE